MMSCQKPPPSVIVAISGRGRILQNLCSHSNNGHLYRISGVIASGPCPGGEWATQNGMDVFYLTTSSALAPASLSTWLVEKTCTVIALAGYLKIFPTQFTQHPAPTIINIHPSLLPHYGGKGMYGMRVHRAVFADKVGQSGATVHIVNEHYDDGPIIAQKSISIRNCRSADAIADKVFSAECQLYPKALAMVCQGQAKASPTQMN